MTVATNRLKQKRQELKKSKTAKKAILTLNTKD
jgi:hypothetical protein